MEDVAPYNFPDDIDMAEASCSKMVPIEPSDKKTQPPGKI